MVEEWDVEDNWGKKIKVMQLGGDWCALDMGDDSK